MAFKIDPRLEAEGEVIAQLQISKLILVNDASFPWVMLVPMIEDVSEIIDLNEDDQAELFGEINFVSHMMKEVFEADKLNIAAIGNKVSQLHIHVIARFEDDDAWPELPFGRQKKPYTAKEYDALKKLLISIVEFDE